MRGRGRRHLRELAHEADGAAARHGGVLPANERTEPLPRGTKAFDYIESDDPNSWKFYGIRLDNKLYPELLPAYKARKDYGKPLEPLTLKYGEANYW